jgi:multicomponent K+:H+ antiporter subunit A
MRWIAFGLLVALATGLGSLALGYPFLTTHTAHLHLPVLGEVHVPSAAFFDLGVFTVVVGSTFLLLSSLSHQSMRARRQQGAVLEDAAAQVAEIALATQSKEVR